MQQIGYLDFSDSLIFHGRTLHDDAKKAVFFNWTGAGFTCTFEGTVLSARLIGVPSPNIAGPDLPDEYPYIGVAVDGNRELVRRVRINAGEAEYELFSTTAAAVHTVRVVKLSENMRGKSGVLELATDGRFLPCAEPKAALNIEFVGDSITCGYGNEAPSPMAPFLPEEENGWMTYGALACASLNADFSTVCVSGICLSSFKFGETLPIMPGINDLYEYTDRIYESGGTSFRPWDFASCPADAVVINIGTNDANKIRMQGDETQGERCFLDDYVAFLQKVRALNGSQTHIFCTLGPLDYFLYDVIREAVARYVARSGDERVSCFKFGGIRLWNEQLASGHPSLAIHERMGRELAAKLREVLG